MAGLATAQIELAKGTVAMFAQNPNGEWVRVQDEPTMLRCLQIGQTCYRLVVKEPDGRALKDIFDREFGRPAESVAVTGPDGGAILTEVILARRD